MRASHVVLRLDPQRRNRANYSLSMILSENPFPLLGIMLS
jgi:hypothetical protein